jgi:plasmid stabilization system protein ParE
MTFDFHPEAQTEFHDATHWYEDRSVFAGDRFVAAMRIAIDAILIDPTRYQPVEDGVRVFRLKKYPFRLYYTFDAEMAFVCIYAVMHEKRRPAYWRLRLPTGA